MTWLSEENMGYRDGICFLHNHEKSSSNPQDSFNNQVFWGPVFSLCIWKGRGKRIFIHTHQLINRLSDTPCLNIKEIKAIVGSSWEVQTHLRSTSGSRWRYSHTHAHSYLCTDITNNRTEFIAHVLREYKLLDLMDSFIPQIQCKLKLSLMLWNHSHRNWVMSTNLSQVEAKAGKLHYQRLDISLSTDWSNTLLVLLRLEWKR